MVTRCDAITADGWQLKP